MTHRIKKGDRIRLKVQTIFGWKGYGIAKRDQSPGDDSSAIINFFREGHDPRENGIATRHEVTRCREQPKHSPFYFEALYVLALDPQDERRWRIRDLGQDICKKHGTNALREFMHTCIELRPEQQNQILGEFNGALNGIGHWAA